MAYSTLFTVEGRGPFPIDMLRYDCCHPNRPEDAEKIMDSYGDRPRKAYTVQVVRTHPQRHWMPTTGRWESFGWVVTELDPAEKQS